MAAIEKRAGETELARTWIDCRQDVLHATERRFPGRGSVAIENAVDRAWMELYERHQVDDPGQLAGRWEALALKRMLNTVRDQRRHPSATVSVERLTELLDATGVPREMIETVRSQARAQEIISQASEDGRRWLEAKLDSPDARQHELAASLGWHPQKLKSVARRTRSQLRVWLRERQAGMVCERRQAVMDVFAATQLTRAGRVDETRSVSMLSSEQYEQVALHIAGCEECAQAWRRAQARLRGRHLVLFPVGFAGKLAGGGAFALAAGHRVLDRLERILVGLRVRAGSGMARVGAGGAAGGAGTAGVLAGKGAAVCAGLLCAGGLSTAAIVGLPTAVVATHRPAVHHHQPKPASHHRTPRAHRASAPARSATVTEAQSPVAPAQSTPTTAPAANTNTTSTAAGRRSRSAREASVHRPTHPVTPGDLIAAEAQPETVPERAQPAATATAASTQDSSQQSSSPTPEATPPSPPATTHSSSTPCLPGTLGC